MPFDDANATLVTFEVNQRFAQVFAKAAIWDLPNFDQAIFGTGGDQVVVVGAELKNSSVTAQRCVRIVSQQPGRKEPP